MSSEVAPVVDIHAHAVPRTVSETAGVGNWHGVSVGRSANGSLEVAAGTSGKRQSMAWSEQAENVDRRLTDMNRQGVDVQVLSLMPSYWVYSNSEHDSVGAARSTNDDFIAMARAHPGRFKVLAHLPLDRPREAVDELHRVMESGVVVGAAVPTHVGGTNWDDLSLLPVLAAAEALGALLFFHPANIRFTPHMPKYHLKNMIGNPAETTLAIASLIFGGVLDKLPGLSSVFAHGGGYASLAAGRFDHGARVRADTQGIESLPSDYLDRMYFDSLLHSPAALRYLIDTVGVDRVLLGSDYPADMGLQGPVDLVDAVSGLTAVERTAMLGGNFSKLLEAQHSISQTN